MSNPIDLRQFEGRKRDHIQHALNPAHQAVGLSGLERIHLDHEALPDLDFDGIKLKSVCVGRAAPTPFFVSGMTAGHADAWQINRTLALGCEARGWAMGVGSQRRDLETGDGGSLDQWKRLREEVPRLTLFANLGISQLIGVSTGKVAEIVKGLGAQALVVHCNPLQEVMQPEGTPHFKGAFDALVRVCRELDHPVVIKETGCGFSRSTLARLGGVGLAAVDVSGLGGTHWGRIEGARAPDASVLATAAKTFEDWGESTVDSVLAVKDVWPSAEIWASGGVRTGLDAAKLIALGAHRVGYAKPALEAALSGLAALTAWMQAREYELKVALFCTGSDTPLILRTKEKAWRPTHTS